ITDKVNAEIPSPVAGVIKELKVEEGATVPVGTEILVIDEGGEAAVEAPAPQPAGATAAASAPAPPPAAQPAPASAPAPAPAAVRRLAEEHNVDIGQVKGTGSGGRVTREDLLQYVAQRQAAPPPAPAPAQAAPAVAPAPAPIPAAPAPAMPAPTMPMPSMAMGDQVIGLTPMRRAIAEHMVRSVRTSPHAWTSVEIDMTNV